jgi:hypothetical protein
MVVGLFNPEQLCGFWMWVRGGREDPELTGYRCDQHVRTMLITLRESCGWNFDETMHEFNTAIEMSTSVT